MSDPLAAVKAVVAKDKNWFVKGWDAFWLNVWAFITTEGKTVSEWSLDPLKVGAIACFGVAIWLVFVTVGFANAGKDSATVGIIGALVATVGGFGSFLFNQANGNDARIRAQWNDK